MRGNMTNNNFGAFGLYELAYRGVMLNKKDFINVDFNVSDETKMKVEKILNDLKGIELEYFDVNNFSDVIYEKYPIIDDKVGVIDFSYKPIFKYNKKNENASDYIDRFRNFDIDSLPLMEIAQFLKLKVEKSNHIKPFGTYIHREKKIVLGTDYAPIFIHELAHAIDFHLSKPIYEENYNELVAELSTVLLCTIYNIPINIPYAMLYLELYSTLEINGTKMVNRASEIVECVKMIKEQIKCKNNI